jgi:hypothetical protein
MGVGSFTGVSTQRKNLRFYSYGNLCSSFSYYRNYTMVDFEWKDAENGTFYFFKKDDGLIVGQVWNYAHTKIFGAKIPIVPNEEKLLGQYVNVDFAKKSVERYWEIQGRTLLENQ